MSKDYRIKCTSCDGTGFISVNWLKYRRKEVGLSQEQLADILGVQRTQISNIEAGRSYLTADKIIPYATALAVTPEELLTALYGETQL